jgi:hypothetical protein
MISSVTLAFVMMVKGDENKGVGYSGVKLRWQGCGLITSSI